MTQKQPFMPDFGQNQVIVGSGASQSFGTLRRDAKQVRIAATGTGKAYYRTFDSRAVSTSPTGLDIATAADAAMPAGIVTVFTKSTHHDSIAMVGAGVTFDVITGEGFGS